VLFAVACGGSSALTAKSLQQQRDAITSAAAEGALLAEQVADDETTEPFARIHSGELADQAKAAAQTLTKARAPAALEAKRREAAADARSTFVALEELHRAPDDQAVARRVEAELEQLAK